MRKILDAKSVISGANLNNCSVRHVMFKVFLC
jgi:hypothetical protein